MNRRVMPAADRAPTFLRNSSSMQSIQANVSGPPEDPVLQALKAGMSAHRNEAMRLFGKLVKLGQGIHLPHLLVDEMQAMAQDAATNGGEQASALLASCLAAHLSLVTEDAKTAHGSSNRSKRRELPLRAASQFARTCSRACQAMYCPQTCGTAVVCVLKALLPNPCGCS